LLSLKKQTNKKTTPPTTKKPMDNKMVSRPKVPQVGGGERAGENSNILV